VDVWMRLCQAGSDASFSIEQKTIVFSLKSCLSATNKMTLVQLLE
jgi:hypothetical protein